MDSPTSNSSSEVAPKKKSSIVGKVLIRGGILLVLLLLAMETSSSLFYLSTLSALDEAIGIKGIPLEEARNQIRGFPLQSEGETADPKGIRKITYRWPSLAVGYQVNIFANDQNVALKAGAGDISYESPDISPEVANQVVTGNEGKPVEDPNKNPRFGFPHGVDQRVMLAAKDFSNTHTMRNRRLGSLARELIRQAVLITARDEMGLHTCDELLGELTLVEENPRSYPLIVDTSAEADSEEATTARLTIHLIRPDPVGDDFKWTSTPMTIPIRPGLDQLAEQMEIISRGNLIEGLKAAGFKPAIAPQREPLSAPEVFSEQMDIVSQYAVLRKLHSERRIKGETFENLKGLVRAYTHLGNMIEYHWTPMSKVYKARAILYADRLIAKFGKTAETLAYRSYVWTLVGNFKLAMEDAAAARAIDDTAVPSWLKLTEAYCNYTPDVYDEIEMSEGEQLEHPELMKYLRMRLLIPNHDIDRSMAAITDMLYTNAACSRAVERMFQTGRLGNVRTAVEGGNNVNWHAIHSRLSEVPGLPENALAISQEHSLKEEGTSSEGDEQSGRVLLIKLLRENAAQDESGDELSWNVLAEMFGDLTFIQSVRSLQVQAEWLGRPGEEIAPQVDVLLKLLEGHPYRNFLIKFKQDRPGLMQPITELVENINPTRYEMQCHAITVPAAWTDYKYYIRVMENMNSHWDKIYHDLLGTLECKEEFMINEAWGHLMEIAPNQPIVVARRLSQTENFDAAAARGWEEKYKNNSYMLLEIGKKYQSQWHLADAMRCFRKSVDLQPTLDGYYQLAYEYHRHGDLEKSKETLEEALSLESYGLEKATTQTKLAELLMREGKWSEAMEHAEEAAGTYSGWGLMLASRCSEGMEDWESAEQYCRQAAEHYGGSSGDNWYMWCARTGKGNLRESKEFAEQCWKDLPRPQYTDVRWHEATGKLLQNDLQGAIDILMEHIDYRFESPHQWLIAGLLADKLGDTKQRDTIFSRVLTTKGFQSTAARLANLFMLSMRDPGKLQWNEYSFLELVESQDESEAPYFYFCAGLFLGLHGEQDLSRKYLQCAATNFYVRNPNTLLATLALREQKIPIEKTRLNVHPEERQEAIRLMNLGYIARQEKEFAKSRKYLDESLKLIPDFPGALLERARLNLREGKPAEAVKDYEQILKFNPESQHAHLYLAQVLCICDQPDVRNGEQAVEHVKAAWKLWPGQHHWHTWLSGASYAERGDYDRAIEFISKSIKMEPKDTDYPKMLDLYQKGKGYYFPAEKLP